MDWQQGNWKFFWEMAGTAMAVNDCIETLLGQHLQSEKTTNNWVCYIFTHTMIKLFCMFLVKPHNIQLTTWWTGQMENTVVMFTSDNGAGERCRLTHIVIGPFLLHFCYLLINSYYHPIFPCSFILYFSEANLPFQGLRGSIYEVSFWEQKS